MAPALRMIASTLGGEAVLGRTIHSQADMEAAIRAGFPQRTVAAVLEATGFSLQELATSLDLSPRSLHRRRHEGRLASHESDRLYRLARTLALAVAALGDRDSAARWLRLPNRALGGRVPLELLDTEPGARSVEDVLGRIAWGGVS